MSTKRRDHAIAKYDNKVYVMGGHNRTDKYLDTCEVFDLDNRQWKPIDSLNEKKRECTAVAMPSGTIYLFGGYSNYVELNSIERYEILKDKWTMLDVKLHVSIHVLSHISHH